ncbi:glycerol-3-phosphate dehydrogenase subunit GlpB [Marinifilum sp. RC60d5]|uniref:glycerol-3-phosphate dehydrogenase subunit GlpB n=1 Tax=Marinifilum sp. RC60d5 TaxID=3458414 RepID=UPI0040354E74
MKFDNIIIGGGLSGLTSGIKLAEQGRKCAIVSSGQSAIHFFSGSFDLLGKINGQEVVNPLEEMKKLSLKHPYQRIGMENIAPLVNEVPQFLKRAGLSFSGQASKNHFVLTPMGVMKPTWLTIQDFTCFDTKDEFPWKKAVILNFSGFLDFHTLFIKDGLKKFEVNAQIKNIAMKEFEAIRRNPSEMRSSNIAKVFDQGEAINEFANKVNELSEGFEVVILPAVFGLMNNKVAADLKEKINKPLVLLPALPPSVPGIRSQIMLRQRFQELGGTYFLGDNVEEGVFENNRLIEIKTNNHGDIKLEADEFILASGSFYSKGIVAIHDKLYEPIFGLDIDGDNDRAQWLDEKFFNDQPYMHYGVKTDEHFRAMMNGKPIENLYVSGSVLGGANPLKEGSGAGISLLTSLHVAEQILK